MSIIYDALKKIQQQTQEPQTKETRAPQKPNLKIPLKILIFALFITAGFYLAKFVFSYVRDMNKKREIKQTQQRIFITPKKENLPNSSGSNLAKKATAIIQTLQEPETKTRPSLNLNGIFYSGKDSWALINNRIVQQGDEIEGATVKKITEGEVILDFYGEEIHLK